MGSQSRDVLCCRVSSYSHWESRNHWCRGGLQAAGRETASGQSTEGTGRKTTPGTGEVEILRVSRVCVSHVCVCFCIIYHLLYKSQAQGWGAPEAAGRGETVAGTSSSRDRGEKTEAGGGALSERAGRQAPKGTTLEGPPGWSGETGQRDIKLH